MIKTALDQLTELQKIVGYVEGPVNVVALLGLFGEAGEVLGEAALMSATGREDQVRAAAVSFARIVDNLKKDIRDKSHLHPIAVCLSPSDELAFDTELCNVLYYLNALAINRGSTLEQLAQRAINILREKSQRDISHGAINSETLIQ